MRSDEENEGYEDFQDVEEDEDVDDDDETAFDDVDYGLEEGDGEGEPSHRLANVFSCPIQVCWKKTYGSELASSQSASRSWCTVKLCHLNSTSFDWLADGACNLCCEENGCVSMIIV